MDNVLWYARHARVVAGGVCYGHSDVPVAARPEVAARELVASFPGRQAPGQVWTSPLSRCLDLARELCQLWAAELCVDEELKELHFGRWEGRSWVEIEASEPEAFAAWMANWRNDAPPGGECPAEIERRARSFVQRLPASEGNVLIAHAGFVRALDVVLFDRSWEEAMEKRIEHLRWESLVWRGERAPSSQ